MNELIFIPKVEKLEAKDLISFFQMNEVLSWKKVSVTDVQYEKDTMEGMVHVRIYFSGFTSLKERGPGFKMVFHNYRSQDFFCESKQIYSSPI